MSTVEITVELPETLAKDARDLNLLTNETIAYLLQAEIDRRKIETEDEAAWEKTVITQALGDALRTDGSIDFARLNTRTVTSSLNNLYPEGDDEADVLLDIRNRKEAY